MNAGVRLVLLALAATPLVAVAAEEAKLSCIKDITYSQEFVTRYPRAGAACREVVLKNGDKWIHFVAEVVKVKDGKVTVNFLNVAGDTLTTVTLAPAADARVTVDKKAKKYSSLQKGDQLDVWMPESRLGFYAEPGAAEVHELPVVSE